ncbi:TlpA family protein disulfide reductase [Rufibacter aurantiacus]|uniref:TlpA family protein disulfide reductase n=1 Tax=Rufibacter aurantiacus TaxID=2817374 RepID=UPI001B3037F6|nr:TlpA disulfide reductase family protein [Rufibacter aurantiacus]
MKYLSLLLLIILSISEANSQQISVVKGRLKGVNVSKISLRGEESALTGAQDEFEGILLDSGRFEIQAELNQPNNFTLFANDFPFAQIYLCPGSDLTVNLDSAKLKYKGVTGDYNLWEPVLSHDILGKYSIAYAQSQGFDTAKTKEVTDFLFKVQKKNLAALPALIRPFSLEACERDYFSYRTKYALYTFLWSDYINAGHSIQSDAYQFMHTLPLDDVAAAKVSLDYNKAIGVLVYLKLRLEKKWYSRKDFDVESDSYNQLFYRKILSTITHPEVKNITLTRHVVGLLSTGSTAAEPLFKEYLNDCKDPFYRSLAFQYYNQYKALKGNPKQEIKIEQLTGSLMESLSHLKGKTLYLDFWASWCGPCIQSFPYTKRLKEKYQDQNLEIVYVNIDDNRGKFEAAAKKLGLKGTIIYLNKEQSLEVRKLLKINGIPHYTLIDKEGRIANANAPHPDSGGIETRLNELLKM